MIKRTGIIHTLAVVKRVITESRKRKLGERMKQILRSEDFLQRAMDKFSRTVYALAFSQMHSRTDAEDICQDVFLRLLEDTTVFRDDEHLKAWLLRVTLNRCHDHFRLAFNRRRVSLEERPDAGEQEPFEDDLWASIQALPPSCGQWCICITGKSIPAQKFQRFCSVVARQCIHGCTAHAKH